MAARLLLADKVNIVKHYYETKNYTEVQHRWPTFSTTSKPTVANIRSLILKFEETGSVANVQQPGRPVSANTAELRVALEASLERSPQKSTRRLSAELGVSQSTVLRSLHDLNYRPYRPRLIHGLLEDDPYQRMQFCEQFLSMAKDDETVLDRVIWSDEVLFKLNGHVNRHNCVYWDSSNPMVTIEKEVNSPGVMVWAGIWSGGIIGPFFFEGHVDGSSYLALLTDQFWPEMGHTVEGQHLWYMQDGAPAHWAKPVRSWLDEKFPNRWIGRGGEIAWPPRSPDLTPPDFFLWGVLKERVYQLKARTIDDLKATIANEIRKVPLELCQKVCRSVPSRLEKCMSLDAVQI
jgi:transposase